MIFEVKMAKIRVLELDLPEILYDHWNNIPIIQEVSKSIIDKLGIKQAQNFIIASLSNAIED